MEILFLAKIHQKCVKDKHPKSSSFTHRNSTSPSSDAIINQSNCANLSKLVQDKSILINSSLKPSGIVSLKTILEKINILQITKKLIMRRIMLES